MWVRSGNLKKNTERTNKKETIPKLYTAFFVMLCIHFQQAALYLVPSVETILYYIGCYWFVVYLQFTVYLQYFGTNRINIVV